MKNIYIYIFVAALVSLVIRALPLTLIRNQILIQSRKLILSLMINLDQENYPIQVELNQNLKNFQKQVNLNQRYRLLE